MAKKQLQEIINETVYEVLGRLGPINEMAVKLKAYKARVDGLRFQLVEIWCLCKWCQLYNDNNDNFSHWINELRTCINNLKFLDIKNGIDKKKTLTRMLIGDYDYGDANMILRIINDKFDVENIINTTQRSKVASEFAANIQDLIEVISNNLISTNSYIENNFNNE